MVVAQAQQIEVVGDRVTFSFSPNQRTLRETFEQNRAWLEGLAQQLAAGRKIALAAVQVETSPAQSRSAPKSGATATPGNLGNETKASTLREQALADAGVQALLEVFPAEIRDVEEM